MNPLRPSILHQSLKSLTIDKQYYLPNADLHFQVEHTVFRVHSYFFTRESPHFRERMAGVDCARADCHDGLSDNTAIPVKGTSSEDFSHFLWVFYNKSYIYSAPTQIWRVILSLSSPTRWDFPKVHALALHHLKELSLPLVDRIDLYKSCSVSLEYLLPLYSELCTRDAALTLEESVRLGWELVVPISQLRERLLKGEGKGEETEDALKELGTAGAGVPHDWIQNRVKSMVNASQDLTSLMSLQEKHQCSLRHDGSDQANLFDFGHVQGKAVTGTRFRNGSCLSEGAPAMVTKGGSSRSKTQALDQAQKLVGKLMPGTVRTKKAATPETPTTSSSRNP